MSRKFPAAYHEPTGYQNGIPVTGFTDQGMVGALLWEYAHARRNILAIPITYSGVLSLSGTALVTAFRMPVPHISRYKPIKIKMRYKTSSDVAGNEVYFHDGQEVALSATYAWVTLTVAASEVNSQSFSLSFSSVDGGSNTLTIASVQAYQVEDTAWPAWTDLSGATCNVGVDDFPYSTHFLKRVVENIQHVRWRRMQRNNLCCHWFRAYKKNGAAYGADEDDLGHYYFVKPAGVSEIYVDLCFDVDASTKMTVKTTVSSSVEGSTESADLNPDASTDALWFSHTYTFAGADITNELELTLKIDGKITSGTGYGYIPGRCIRPKHIETAVTHTLPSVQNVAPGTDCEAADLDQCRDTVRALRSRIGLQHLLADWCWNATSADDYGEMTPGTGASYDKGDHGSKASTIARAIMFASQGAKRIKVSVGYRMANGADDNVELQYLLSDSMTEATNDDSGPTPGGALVLDGEAMSAGQAPGVIRETKSTLDIADTTNDVEIPSGALTRAGAVPHQIWVQSIGTADSYLLPRWVVIYEDLLGEFDLG